MKLNINFNKKLEPLINSSEELSNWFEKNQEVMAYYELNHPGCLHFEGSSASFDVLVLGRMANACLSWLESELTPDEEKVQLAIDSIDAIYEVSKNLLSDVAKGKYSIKSNEKKI